MDLPTNNTELFKLRSSGLTLRVIAEILTVRGRSLTYQRIQQLCRGMPVPIQPIKEKATRICLACDKSYIILSKNQKYCGRECSSTCRVTPKSKSSKYGFVALKCKQCGIAFTRSHYRQAIAKSKNCKKVFCTRKCYRIYLRKESAQS